MPPQVAAPTILQRMRQSVLFQELGYQPHEGQHTLHRAKQNHRFRVPIMGRRTGKSTAGGHELTTEAHRAYGMRSQLQPKGKRHEYWIVGPEYSDAEKEFRVLYNDIQTLGMPMDKPGTYYDANGGEMILSLWGGRFLVQAKSAKYPGTLVGEGLQGLIMAEAAKLKEVVWTKYCRPMLADYARERSWALFSTTPEGKNWLYRAYMRGISTDPLDSEWFGLRLPSWSNNILFPDGRNDPEILEMERDMSPEKFKQEIGADFSQFVGRVFKDFEEETHVGDYPYNPAEPVYIAMDKGFRAPAVVLFLQLSYFGTVKVIGEYYQKDRTAIQVGRDVLDDPKLGPLTRVAVAGYPDPASPEWNAELEEMWQVKMRGATGGDIGPRLELIRKYLMPYPFELEDGHPEKIPRLLIDRSCKNTIREFGDYRYPETMEETGSGESDRNPTENPMKKDDHTPEAIGRFFAGHFGEEMAVAKTRITQANYGGRR